MKKLLLIILLGFMALLVQSCTHTCTCTSPNGTIHEIEVDPTESCSDRSGDLWGECS